MTAPRPGPVTALQMRALVSRFAYPDSRHVEQLFSRRIGSHGATDVPSTPLAISVIPSAASSRFAIRTIDEASPQTPSVTFTQNTTFGQLSIRGIGTNAVLAGADPSSAMYLDGVYLARPAMAFTDFDVKRIEFLRGPQGTLYGRNALGGAVNLTTRAPSNDFEALAGPRSSLYPDVTAGSPGSAGSSPSMSSTIKSCGSIKSPRERKCSWSLASRP